MPSPVLAGPEDSEASACDSEQKLPELPKKWKALPPTRHGVQPAVAQVVETSSGFRSLVTSMFQQLKDIRDGLHTMQSLQDSILEQHYLEINEMSRENNFLRLEMQQKGGQLNPSSDRHIKKVSPKGTQSFTLYSSQGEQQSEPPSPASPVLQLQRTPSQSMQVVAMASAQSRWTAESADYQSSGEESTQLVQTAASVDPGVVPMQWMLTGSKSIRGLTQSGSNLFKGFVLRDEWVINDDDFLRIAAKGTLEPSVMNEDTKFGGSENLAQAMSGVSVRRVPIHPESTRRLCWDCLAGLLLAYDTIMLPLYLFEFEGNTGTQVMDWLTAFFWTFDIPASLLTGIYVKGRLETKASNVFMAYSRTWMVPDVVMVLVEWTLLLVGTVDSGLATSVGAVRNMRVLRFIRLVRLVKFDRLVKQLTRRINSVIFLLSLRIIKMVCAIVAINHIIASAWYAIGVDGWVEIHIPDRSDLAYCYLTSFHWSLTQFHGSIGIGATGLKERFFSVVVLLTALVSVTWFMSSMTNSMIMLQKIHQERTSQTRALLGFLSQRHVTNSLAVRIKEYVAMHRKENPTIIKESDVHLLDILPTSLLTDLHEELRGQKIRLHPLFAHLSTFFNHFLRQLAQDAVREFHYSAKEVVFSTGQACKHMLFTNSEMYYFPGNLRVPTVEAEDKELPRARRISSHLSGIRRNRSFALGEGCEIVHCSTWLSEPALWTLWQHCGALRTSDDCYVFALQVEGFLEAVQNYERARLDAIVYARVFVEFLNVTNPSDLPSRVDAFKVWHELEEVRKSQLSQKSLTKTVSGRSCDNTVGKRLSMLSSVTHSVSTFVTSRLSAASRVPSSTPSR